MPINIMITDDHSMIREGLKNLLELDGDIKIIEEAVNGQDCLLKLETIKPDILLLDINMPVMNGLEVLQKIKEDNIDIKVLVLTVHNEVEYLMKAVDIGINGYVLKDSESSVLKKAIYSIMEGEDFIQQDLLPALNSKLIEKEKSDNLVESLTDREIEVIKLLAAGLFNKEIAEQLNISERTVKNHISNIFKKLNLTDRTQAAVFAIKNGIVDIF